MEWVAVFNVYFVGWGRVFFFVWMWGVGPEWVRCRFACRENNGWTIAVLSHLGLSWVLVLDES